MRCRFGAGAGDATGSHWSALGVRSGFIAGPLGRNVSARQRTDPGRDAGTRRASVPVVWTLASPTVCHSRAFEFGALSRVARSGVRGIGHGRRAAREPLPRDAGAQHLASTPRAEPPPAARLAARARRECRVQIAPPGRQHRRARVDPARCARVLRGYAPLPAAADPRRQRRTPQSLRTRARQ